MYIYTYFLLEEYNEMQYFRNKFDTNINDYKLINDSIVIGHKVTFVEDSLEILNKM